MIDKLTYDQILQVSKELKTQVDIINQIADSRNMQEIRDFASTVEGYTKFLENTVEIHKDADNALAGLKKELKK